MNLYIRLNKWFHSLSEEDLERIEGILNGQNDANMQHVSLGIRNVNSRLKLIYGEECGLTIRNLCEDEIPPSLPENTSYTISTIKTTISDKKEQR